MPAPCRCVKPVEDITLSTPLIYLLRHGETEWNLARRFQGGGDSPLTARGAAQAADMGALLARVIERPGDFVLVSSPQGRAARTAAIVGAALGLAAGTDARLRELSLGAWDGLTMDEVDAEFPRALDGANRSEWYFRAPGGESYDSADARLADWLAGVARPTIAVSHGLAGRLLRGRYAGLARSEALALPVPQDGVFRLTGGAIEYLPCAAVSRT